MLSSPPRLFAALMRAFAALSRPPASRSRFEDLVLGHHRGQPVGADQEEIALRRFDEDRVDVDVEIGAEGAGDHGALWMCLCLLGCEPSASDQVADERVILGELLECVFPHPVCPRVADVADRDGVVAEERGRDGRPHPRETRVLMRPLEDPAVGLLDDRLETLGRAELVGLVELAEGGCGEA